MKAHPVSLPPLVALLVLSGLPLTPMGAEAPRAVDPPPRPNRTFEERADVFEVQVPVNVVAPDGAPVRGLTRDDFEVVERGKRLDITAFEVVDLETLRAGEGGVAAEPPIPAAARRHFLLLFDLSFSTPTSILRARQAARDFVVEELHPTDLAAVMTFSLQHGLRLLVTFTPDRAQLARAIATLGAPSLLENRVAHDPLRFMIEEPPPAGEGTSGGELGSTETPDLTQGGASAALRDHLQVIAEAIERQERSYQRGRIAAWSGTMQSLADAMGEVEGRKHVVYFSEGFDGRLLLGRDPDFYSQEQQIDRRALETGQTWRVDTDDLYGNTVAQNDLARMIAEFERAGCSIQAVDISGLRADTRERARARKVGREVLFYLANETGGEFLEHSNELGRQLQRMLAGSSVTYLLTFRPVGVERDGEYHAIEVEVNRDLPRGTRVSYREGYFAPKPFEELHPLEKSLLAADAIAAGAPKRQIGVEVLAAPFRAGERSAYVPVIIEIDGRSLLVGQEREALPLEIFAYVTDEKSEMRDFFTQSIGLDVSEGREALVEGGVKYYGHLELAPGEHLVRVLVRNGHTGRVGVTATPVTVPEFEDADPFVVGPFFYETSDRWILVREQTESEQGTVVYPFTVNGDPFVPAVRPALGDGEAARLFVVGYNLGPGEVEFEGSVVTSGGEPLPGGVLDLQERTVTGIRGLDKLVAVFDPTGLEAGEYTLRVRLTGTETGVTRTSSAPFSVLN